MLSEQLNPVEASGRATAKEEKPKHAVTYARASSENKDNLDAQAGKAICNCQRLSNCRDSKGGGIRS